MRTLVSSFMLALALVTACASSRGSRPGTDPTRTVLVVDNRGFADMTAYVVTGGQRIRLGIANGLSKTELTIPATAVSGAGDLQFYFDPIGGTRAAVSERIYVRPGDRVTLLIN